MTPSPVPACDRDLLSAVRGGHTDAYAGLYERYCDEANRYAKKLLNSPQDADDAVSEAFVRILSLLQRGRGPQDRFAPYLMRSVRNICYDRLSAAKQCQPSDDPSALEEERGAIDRWSESLDQELSREAFEMLPVRWKQVLWLICIEELSCEEAAGALAVSDTALTSLSSRAREGLRQNYVLAHVRVRRHPTCARRQTQMVAVIRGTSGVGTNRLVDQHLQACAPCSIDFGELVQINETVTCARRADTPRLKRRSA